MKPFGLTLRMLQHTTRGEAHYRQQGDYDRAIADFDETLSDLAQKMPRSTTTEDPPTGNKGDYDRAIADYDEAHQT